MMGNIQLTPQQLEALLKFASARLGISQEALARSVQSGDPDALGLSPEYTRKLEGLIGNRAQTEELLRSPQIKEALERLWGGDANNHG